VADKGKEVFRVVINGSRRRCGTPDYPAPAELQNLLARIKLDLR
jgi:hypothetical protein